MVFQLRAKIFVLPSQLIYFHLHPLELPGVLVIHLSQFLLEVLLLLFDPILQEVRSGNELLFGLNWLLFAVPYGVLLNFLVLEVLPTAVVWTHEVDLFHQIYCFAFQEILLAENTLEISILYASLANVWILCLVCTICTRECFADAALPWFDSDHLTYHTFQVGELVGVRSA